MEQRSTVDRQAETGLTPEALRQVATEHKVVMWCIVVALAPTVLFELVLLASPEADFAPILSVWMALWAVVSVASAIVVFSLARRLTNASVAATLALLSFIPLLGLCIMLVVDRKAMEALRDSGYRIGLLAAKPVQATTT